MATAVARQASIDPISDVQPSLAVLPATTTDGEPQLTPSPVVCATTAKLQWRKAGSIGRSSLFVYRIDSRPSDLIDAIDPP